MIEDNDENMIAYISAIGWKKRMKYIKPHIYWQMHNSGILL